MLKARVCCVSIFYEGVFNSNNHVNAFIKKVKYLEFFFIKSSRRLKKTNTFLLSRNILFLFKYNSFTGKKF